MPAFNDTFPRDPLFSKSHLLRQCYVHFVHTLFQTSSSTSLSQKSRLLSLAFVKSSDKPFALFPLRYWAEANTLIRRFGSFNSTKFQNVLSSQSIEHPHPKHLTNNRTALTLFDSTCAIYSSSMKGLSHLNFRFSDNKWHQRNFYVNYILENKKMHNGQGSLTRSLYTFCIKLQLFSKKPFSGC